MTLAACETVTDPAGEGVEALSEALTFDSPPGVADPLDGRSAVAWLGGTSAADGGTDPTDADCDAEAEAGGDAGAWDAGLCAVTVAVEDADGASEDGGAATRGACVSTFVTGGFTAAVGDAGATGVTTGAVVVCVTGAAGVSTACCV
jgi:hypothetical protein